MKKTQTLYVLQGWPGSGKSRVARLLASGLDHNEYCALPIICSTDSYFYAGGEYKFDALKLGEYHAKNLAHARYAMDMGYTVIVDNTNILRWHSRGYVRHAVDNNIPVVFIRVVSHFPNTHEVPSEVVQRMQKDIEDLTIDSVLASKTPWESDEYIR